MNGQNIAVIRVTGRGGCGCSHSISSCHIFIEDTEEELQKQLEETLLEWLLMGKKEKDIKKLSKERCKELDKDRDKVMDLISQNETMIEIESFSEQWEYLNVYCEFTQVEDNSTEDLSYKESFSPAKRAWITRKAIKEGKNPIMVHAGHKAAFTRNKKKS